MNRCMFCGRPTKVGQELVVTESMEVAHYQCVFDDSLPDYDDDERT